MNNYGGMGEGRRLIGKRCAWTIPLFFGLSSLLGGKTSLLKIWNIAGAGRRDIRLTGQERERRSAEKGLSLKNKHKIRKE